MADFESFEAPSGGPLQDVTIPVGDLTIAKKTSNVGFDGNLNAGGNIASLATILESESLFDSVVSTSSTASDATLLTDLVSSTTGASDGLTVDLGMQLGDKIELSAMKGGRTLQRTFEVGAPPPYGGTTLGDLRDFIEGTLGIAAGAAPGSELLSSVRQSEKSGNAETLFVFTAALGNAAAVNFDDASLPSREEAIVISVPGSTGAHLFFIDEDGGGSPLDTDFDSAGTTITNVPVAANHHAVALGADLNTTLTSLATAINTELGSTVSASVETIGGNLALKVTSLQTGPAGNLVSYENGLGEQSSNVGTGNLTGGTSSIDVSGTVDFDGDKAYLGMRFSGLQTTSAVAAATASLFTSGEKLTFQTPDGTSVSVTASATGPTTGNQFEIETLLSGQTGQEPFENNLQTIKNLANAINQNSALSKEVVATVRTQGTNIDLVLESVKAGTYGNNISITGNSGAVAHLGDSVIQTDADTGANITLLSRTTSLATTYAQDSGLAPGTIEAGGSVSLQDGGSNADSMQITRQNIDGTSDVAYSATSSDFVSEGLQIGDFIRLGSGSEAGTIGVITAVGVNSLTGVADTSRIEFRVAAGSLIPSSGTPGGQTWYVHEAAGVSISAGSFGLLRVSIFNY